MDETDEVSKGPILEAFAFYVRSFRSPWSNSKKGKS